MKKLLFVFSIAISSMLGAMQNKSYQYTLGIVGRSERSFDVIREEILDIFGGKVETFWVADDKKAMEVYFVPEVRKSEIKNAFADKEWFHKKNIYKSLLLPEAELKS